MRLSDFVRRKHSFVARRSGRWATDAEDTEAPGWDTGWKISLREPKRHLIERTEVYGPGDIGSVFGDVVYHNFYSVRFDNPKQELSPSEHSAQVSRSAAINAWNRATTTLLPERVLREGRRDSRATAHRRRNTKEHTRLVVAGPFLKLQPVGGCLCDHFVSGHPHSVPRGVLIALTGAVSLGYLRRV